MITPAILEPISLVALALCLLIAALLPHETLDALAWWRDFLGQVLDALTWHFLAWWERTREAFIEEYRPGRWD